MSPAVAALGPRPRAILFDWDNTLVDSWAAIADALAVTFRAMGREPWTRAETRRRVRRSLADSFPTLFGDRWRDARDIFYRSFTESHLVTLRPCAGAGELLAALRRDSIFLGVVSNKRGDLLRREAAHLGWERHFGSVVGAGDAAADKPAPEPIRLALAPAGLAGGAEVWMVGDAGVDMDCARRAGCRAVLIGAADPGAAEFRGCPPDACVADLPAFARLARGR